MSSVLEVRDIACEFAGVMALDGVSIAVREGEFFALLGASGSGKTTLLRILAGFQAPTRGEVLLDGVDITALPPERRPVNMMFQSYALFPHLSVEKNVRYGLEMERLPKAEIAERVAEALATVRLDGLARRRPDQLSGGQRQRVALARALVKRPRVLLLDEPLAALDAKLRAEMQLELTRLQEEVGITFVVVTHDQDEALVMADRIALLDAGRVAQCDTPRAVYEQPASRFVADFIGVTNFLPVTREGEQLSLRNGTPVRVASPLPDGADLVVAVRPERLHLVGPDAEHDNAVEGRIVARAYHGLDLQLHVATPAADAPVIMRVTADVADRHALATGQRVRCGWSARDTRPFINDA